MSLPSTWVLKAVATFPATRITLAGIAENHGAKNGDAVVDGLLSEGRLVMLGEGKGARYALPGTKAKRRRK